MKYSVFSILCFVLIFCAGSVSAQERGIGVSAANIEIGEDAEWPYTMSVFVTNFSSQEEVFEIILEDSFISVNPGRFMLEGGEQQKVMFTFDPPAGGPG